MAIGVELATISDGDLPEAKQVYASSFDLEAVANVYWQHLAGDDRALVGFAAHHRGDLVGISLCRIAGRCGHIERLVVLPDYRGNYIGEALAQYSCEALLFRGVRCVVASSRLAGFWQSVGFEEIQNNLWLFRGEPWQRK